MLDVISESILVSGPSVSDIEVDYAADAARNGWNSHCYDYISRFEAKAREILDVPYALALSSCTGALHLAMLALGIGPGDEVILPESTWIATANVVEYVGAKCVFADVHPESWTVTPESIARCVGPRTKAVIVTHLYGHPCDMRPIMELARARSLYVVEDAAQCLGGEIDGKKAGTVGDIGCFSFHGSKAIVMGEGGLLVTRNGKLYNRAKFLGDQGKHPTIRFYNTELGYKYKLSNLQAAFGLGQLERIGEILEKKRQIFEWYRDFLSDVPDIRLNARLYQSLNTYWMPTVVMGDSYSLNAEEVMDKLAERRVESRPFFFPLSSLPMYQDKPHAENPEAYRLHDRALNLPAGPERRKEEIEYVCAHLKDILRPGSADGYRVGGWLKIREDVLSRRDEWPVPVIGADYPNGIAVIDAEAAARCSGDELRWMKRETGLASLMAQCRVKERRDLCGRLAEMGFTEVQRVPVGRRGGEEKTELIKSPFTQPEDYLATFQI